MESLRVWLLSLAGVALLTALASLFPTSESLRRITKLAGGIALTCLLFSPLVTFDYDAYAAALQDYHVSVSIDGAVSDSSERLQRTRSTSVWASSLTRAWRTPIRIKMRSRIQKTCRWRSTAAGSSYPVESSCRSRP